MKATLSAAPEFNIINSRITEGDATQFGYDCYTHTPLLRYCEPFSTYLQLKLTWWVGVQKGGHNVAVRWGGVEQYTGHLAEEEGRASERETRVTSVMIKKN